ncbi:MAG: PilZ domain-containing protein [Halomonadaceae bacterium]|nr:MAG: PilZ domain-containing protein [Halomonadaceae bacterium]
MENRSKVSPNLRHHHRVPVTLEALLETQLGAQVTCTVENLSRAGLMVRCPPQTVQQLLPNREPVSPHQAVPVKLWLEIGSSLLAADGDVIYVRRASCDRFHVGISFSRFEDDSEERLKAYVMALMAKP